MTNGLRHDGDSIRVDVAVRRHGRGHLTDGGELPEEPTTSRQLRWVAMSQM